MERFNPIPDVQYLDTVHKMEQNWYTQRYGEEEGPFVPAEPIQMHPGEEVTFKER